MLIVLSMIDIAQQNDIEIELEHLKGHMGCEVLPLQLTRKQDYDKLLDTIELACIKAKSRLRLNTTKW